MFYALIAGLLEVGVIVPIVVRAVCTRTVARDGDCEVELAEDEGHAPILLDSRVACKRRLYSWSVRGEVKIETRKVEAAIDHDAKDPSRDIR